MVGRKTSPRCANCRQRKVKCDLARPSCSQCLKSKWPCPGYDDHSRFYAYARNASKATPSIKYSGRSSSSDIATPAGHVSLSTRRNRSVSVFPLSDADTLRNKLIFKISIEGVAARLMVVPEANVLKHIPIRVGANQALDDAVSCICTNNSHRTFTSPTENEAFVNELYPKALKSLHQALSTEGEHVSAETMAAATLLQMHEHSTAHFQQGWITHANGVIKMLELRGPAHVDNELDAAILHAETGNIFIDALQNRKVSFLTDPRWKALLRVGAPYFGDAKRNAAHNAMITVGFFIPGILARFEDYNAGNESAKSLIQDLNKASEPLQEWEALSLLQESCSPISEDPLCPVDQNLRMSHASQIAFNVFRMVIQYIALDVNSSLENADHGAVDLHAIFGSYDISAATARFEDLANDARAVLPALQAIDDLAASNTAWFMNSLLQRVLSAASKDTRLDSLQQNIRALSQALAAAIKTRSNVSAAVSTSFPAESEGDS